MSAGTQIAVQVLEQFEGCVLSPYYCAAGKCTIGIGSTRWEDGRPIKPSDGVISRARAIALASKDLVEAERYVDQMITVPLNPYQKAALILFTQNLGHGALQGSSLRRFLNAGNYEAAALEFVKWGNARVGGKLVPLRGLVIRRRAEQLIFRGITPLKAFEQASAENPR
jgi:lysozyme